MGKIRCKGCDAVFEDGGDFHSHLTAWHGVTNPHTVANDWQMPEGEIHPSRGRESPTLPIEAQKPRERTATPAPPRDDDETPAPPAPPRRGGR